jgi:SAM-dependent methyltransferase
MTQLAIPPADMMFLATAGRDKDVFLATGLADRDHVLSFLNAAGVRPQADRGQADRLRILDWGCGCGRIARHWEPFASKVELHGCDVAAEPIRWCQENLPFGRFAVSGHNPPLPYTDGQFDAVYATSVLTHLTFDSQYRWMQELWRVLKPGGVAVLTAHGPTLLPNILPGLVNASGERVSTILIDEELFLCVEYDVGSNQTGNMMTHAVLARIFAPFSLVTHRPRHGLMGIQDTYVFAKKDGTSPVVTDDFFSQEMRGTQFRASIDVPFGEARNLSLLATVDRLLHPATVQLTVRRPGSDTVIAASKREPLPLMLAWTGLRGAFSSLSVESLPESMGAGVVEVAVSCDHPLDGLTLQLRKAIVF